jgi:hypothetical protein
MMNFYASREFLDVVAEVYCKGRESRVADVRVGDEVLRLLEVDRKRLFTNAVFLDYHEPLRDDEIRAPTREHDFVERVSRDIVELGPDGLEEPQGFQLAPFVDWSRFSTFKDYEAFLLARQRRLVRERERRARRLADQLGKLVFRMDDPAEDVLALAREWKSHQLRETGLRDIFAEPETNECLDLLRQRGLMTSSTLRAAGRLLAVWIGFVHERTWSGWIFAYDRELAKYSPGHQLLSAMLQESYRLGHREFDFSTGAEDYKMLYATHGRLLGPVGRPPVRRRVYAYAKEQAERRAPQVLAGARAVKSSIEARSEAPAAAKTPSPAAFDTAPPLEPSSPPAMTLQWVKARALGKGSALLVPILRRTARELVGGDTIEDALAVARKLAEDGASSTLGYWETADSGGRPVVDVYLEAVERVAASGLDSTLSIKPPAMSFDAGFAAELAAAAAKLGVRIHCDSHGSEVADPSHAMEQAMLESLSGASLSTTLPGRWSRSLSDAERAIELGLAVRVVKGQWPDPGEPKRDMQAGFLEVIDRLAGRARHVGVATHEVPLAAEAIARLQAAGTPCELELLFGRPMAQPLRWAREQGVRVRIYVPYGAGYIPSAIGILRQNPRVALRLLHGVIAESLERPRGNPFARTRSSRATVDTVP